VSFEVTDLGETYALEVRRGVAQFHDDGIRADATLAATRSSLMNLLLGQASLEQLRTNGQTETSGDESVLMTFLGAIEGPAPIYLTVR
jgi:alkyl sulfatase BDS1-like metallo-beta-lactamase superfamily hydrolase